MNTYIARWKTKYGDVQTVIDALPESHDHTSEIPACDIKSLTISDNMSQNDEEIKDQETMITEKKVT